MASTHEQALERIQGTVIDGRTENVRFRQGQLQSLHKTLREEASSICRALTQDSPSSAVEVETEFYLALDAVRHFYDTLDLDKELQEEYSVAHGSDNKNRRVGAGLVIIRPTTHTRFFSVVNPLAAAISAGNCVILELQDTLLQLDSTLRTLLPKALDQNSFYLSSTRITEPELLDSAILVDQTTNGPPATLTTHLLSSSGTRTVAVVDRTADIDAAARAITAARFGFGGTSPYAPDLVLVNEFVKKDFFEACSKYASLSFAKEGRKPGRDRNEPSRKAIREAEEKRQVSSFGSEEFKLVDVLDKNTPIMTMKITGRYLPIATCSSLVDAIFNQEFEKPLLAGYFFAEPRAAKYLSQHLSCHVSLINHIPVQLLVGPAAPVAHAPDILYRYTKDMFSLPRPQFVEPAPEVFKTVEEVLVQTSNKTAGTQSSKLRALAVRPLGPVDQRKNEMLGFFETGFFTGAGITLSVVLPVISWGAYVVGRKGLEYAVRFRQR
ncbi:ALDH-like protein [Coniochaeta ligniaria NRRL 30616]|uniref:ALDH-like protein n=1 Tax=Coniochaeta ligniaria NRRL 30616 TaxID=1408157 RepID=A0A1J7JPQ6_9PEZI|nr:ALDH-like protein [Coniochaeta ligniaria NRRL 30616]